ncbi:aspartate aminotransferase family protein [Candidatus Viadribacter manganicus]|uniref:Acetylornithine aminotransferase n=1 Tax=Candidatus Viadribacter manganicus TaxID=1759059 RepID=A0A1B1AFT7_9PROT|nr:aspartate aminotransferase family protein [Candidatus Viadribacter manganicus]ANP45429.1 acetylornithine aminotransferase [Candidatus Viadribacter manganicus]
MSAAESHILPVYSPPEQIFERGEGCWIWDDKGEKYLDCIAGISVNAFGHAPPFLVKTLTEQAGKLWHTSNMFKIKGQEELAAKYTRDCFADVVFFTNSGTEAIEGSLKTARKYHSANGHPERIDIIGFQGSFHGRSYAAINASGTPAYLEGFGPRLPGFIQVPYGDEAALRAAISPTTAALIIEPVQGEGGVRAVPEETLRLYRKLADENGFLIIFDEVQSGAGRTGKMWAHQWSGMTPDIMAVAKGVGGGFPMGAFMATKEAAKGMVVGVHGTTFGGNPLAMAVGNAAYDELSKPAFLEHVNKVANYLSQALEGLKDRHPQLVVDVRGKGLLRGIKLTINPKEIQAKLRARKVLVGVAGDNVLRIAPPLTIKEDELRQLIDAVDAVLAAQMAEASA